MAQLTFNPDTPNAWVVTLKEGENTVGRADDNDVRVEEGGVSGYHCRISLEQGLVTITDLNSTNGTHINGARINQSGWAPGQIIHLGHLPVRLDTRLQAAAVAANVVTATPATAVSAGSTRLRISGHAPAASGSHSESESGATTVEVPPVEAPTFVTAPPNTRCRSHSKSLAAWSCPKCHKYLCDLCVATRSTSAGPSHMCRGCGVECLPVRTEWVVEKERGFFVRLPGAFAFPVKGVGVLVLILATILFEGIGAIPGLSVYKILLRTAVTGYLFLFLQNIIHGANAGEETMPGLPEFDGIFGAFFTLLGTILISFIVPIGLGIAKLCDVDIPTSALVAGMFVGILYFPMAFLAVAILDSVAAANPLVVVPSILKVPLEYFVTVVILSAVFIVRWLGGITAIQANSEALSTTDMSVLLGGLAVRVLWGLISVYLLTVAVRILGLLYVTQREKLGWL